jgi:threonine dehydrogenase-like Zn-dependent dehydrogenase
MNRSRRALLFRPGQLGLVELDWPTPGPNQVLLRPDVLGLCSSDVHIWLGRKAGQPGIPGHEGAGTVVEVGTNVDGWRVGDIAVVNPLLNCGTCGQCRSGTGHVCPQREIVGYNGRGLMATAVVLEARSLVRPPAGMPRYLGAMVEPLACVVHAQDRLGLPAAPSMAVVGAGPMGALHVMCARQRGVQRLCLVDTIEEKLALARARGVPADEFLTPADSRRWVGVDVAVTACSSRAGHQLAVDLCRNGGVLLAFASILDDPGGLSVRGRPTDTDEIHRRESRTLVQGPHGRLTVVGAIGFDESSFVRAAHLLTEPVGWDRFITARVGLSDIPRLLPDAWRRNLKVSVDPSR